MSDAGHEVEVVGMRRFSTNYSLAPNYRTEVRLTLVGGAFEPHAEQVGQLVRQAEVNGVVTLHTYIQLHASGDAEAIAMVQAQNPEHHPTKGGGTTTVTLELSDGGSLEIEQWSESFTGMSGLYELLLNAGTRSVFDPSDFEDRLKVRDEPTWEDPMSSSSSSAQTEDALEGGDEEVF